VGRWRRWIARIALTGAVALVACDAVPRLGERASCDETRTRCRDRCFDRRAAAGADALERCTVECNRAWLACAKRR
jgi:hypothetical protein